MAQGYYGTASNPLAELHSERIVFTGSTSDPSNTVEGDWWLRTDVSEFRFDNGSGVWQIPVFPTGGSGSGVIENLRVEDTLESSVSRDADTNPFQTQNSDGIVIETHGEITETTAILSEDTSGATTAYLLEFDGTEIESTPISGGEVTFTTTLSGGARYRIEADADGAEYDAGQGGSPSFPYTGTHVDITDGSVNGASGGFFPHNFITVETTISEGFVPAVNVADFNADFPQLRFQHDSSFHGLHGSEGAGIASSAIHHWPMDEGSGSTLTDAIASADASMNYSTWASDADFIGNTAPDTDGTNDETTASQSSLENTGDSGTLALTHKSDDVSSQQCLFSIGGVQPSDPGGVSFRINSSGTYLWVVADSFSSFDQTIDADTPYRIHLVWDTGDYWIYRNGTEIDSGTYSSTVDTTVDGDAAFGWDPRGQDYHDGQVDDVILADEEWGATERGADLFRQSF